MNSIIYFILILLIPLAAQLFVSSSYGKYKKIENSQRITGYDIARRMLDNNGLKNMYVVITDGTMSDHYDPKRKTVRLSDDVYNGTSIAALAIAAHETGHALQDKDGYLYMKIRSFIFPIVSLGTKFAYIVLLIGFIFQMLDLIWLGILLVGLGFIFQVITLPVEFNASARAKEEIMKYNFASSEDLSGVNKMLKAAAYTYVAGVLASALELLRLISIVSGRD
ncbi:MAG: zinc metallopeptidase [Bacilli bacterium]|nr:zinc metallopeptidase [Bacilli bacterium]MDD4407157.1 zinc metallopeptidase [Bacilli bacterium]